MTVKPERTISALIAAGVATLLTAAALGFVWRDALQDDRSERLGSALTSTLAHSSIEPIVASDRIHLGVLANRLTAIDGVLGVSVYDADDQLLALSGDNGTGEAYSAPVTLDGTIIGFVRVTLEPEPAAVSWLRGLASALVLLIVPVAAAFAAWPLLRFLRRTSARVVAAPPASGDVVAWVESGGYLVFANLYNQLSLANSARTAALRRGVDTATAVARLYGGSARLVEGRGIVLSFDSDPPRPFQIACAAFVLAECLGRDDGPAEYRLGIHRFEVHMAPDGGDEDGRDMRPVATADAALLSALALPGTVVASGEFCAELGDGDQVCADPFRHPLLDDLETIGGMACRVALRDSEHERLIDRQANAVLAQPVSRRSTF